MEDGQAAISVDLDMKKAAAAWVAETAAKVANTAAQRYNRKMAIVKGGW